MLNDKTILVTGGTGSFGKKFLKMVFERYCPKKVIIYSRDEFKQSVMKTQFQDIVDINRVRFFIGDVRDKQRLNRALRGVDYVIHAAAMKQVPTCEYNPLEAVKTNINGAQNVIDACLDCGVKKAVALSTDKSVNPINLYGGTKLVSDKLFIAANAYTGENGTVFSIVRYGNVAGSRGSVIPIFENIIRSGKTELPITDLRMTRFFITLEEGVELVFKALEESKGGETYISKIPSFHIEDLAKAILPGCSIKEIGIREGEKLHEVMVTRDDSRMTYEYDKHYIVYPNFEWMKLDKYLSPGGKPVKEGFEYNSGTNREWMDSAKLKEALEKLSYE